MGWSLPTFHINLLSKGLEQQTHLLHDVLPRSTHGEGGIPWEKDGDPPCLFPECKLEVMVVMQNWGASRDTFSSNKKTAFLQLGRIGLSSANQVYSTSANVARWNLESVYTTGPMRLIKNNTYIAYIPQLFIAAAGTAGLS